MLNVQCTVVLYNLSGHDCTMKLMKFIFILRTIYVANSFFKPHISFRGIHGLFMYYIFNVTLNLSV